MQTPSTAGRALLNHVWHTLVLAWPMVLSRIGIIAMGTVDVIVLGRAGSDQLADYILGQAIYESLISLAVGLTLGVPVLVAREVGAGNNRAAGVVWRRGLSFAAAAGIAICLLLQFSEHLYVLGGQTAGQSSRAAAVTRVLAVSLPFVAIFAVCTSYLEALHRPMAGFYAIALGNCLNLGLNVLLVSGAGPVPALGAVGCALATSLTSACLALLSVLYVRFLSHGRRHYGVAGGRAPRSPAPRRREQMLIGAASGGSYFFAASALAVLTMFVGWFGTLSLAAHGILLQFLALNFMIAYGIAGATQVRVGNAWGRGNAPATAMAGWTGLAIATVLTLACTVAVFLRPEAYFGFFTSDMELVQNAGPVLLWLFIAAVFDGGQTVLGSACRGRGDSWVPTLLNFGSYWIMMVPMSWLLAVGAERGLAGIYQGILIASVVSTSVLGMRFHALTFIRETRLPRSLPSFRA